MPETIGQIGQTQESGSALLEKEGKYLTFALGSEEYGLEILKVREIIGYMDITAVPQTPHYIKGVINLRGQVIPVVGLRAKFGMERTDVTEESCIIVVEVNRDGAKSNTGLAVDRVSEVVDIAGSDIERAPQFGSSVNTDFILGMGKIGDSVKILLDIDQVLADVELNSARNAANAQQQQEDQESPDLEQPEPKNSTEQQQQNQGENPPENQQ